MGVRVTGRRAQQTCELAGLRANAEMDPDLVEWNYEISNGRRARMANHEQRMLAGG
jgi:hypothetical protein